MKDALMVTSSRKSAGDRVSHGGGQQRRKPRSKSCSKTLKEEFPALARQGFFCTKKTLTVLEGMSGSEVGLDVLVREWG